jgi:uncharacterized protein (DUF488 family)
MIIVHVLLLMNAKTIWTIGHSTRSIGNFIDALKKHEIKMLVDVRTFPGSKRYPHFNKENISVSLKGVGIEYIHMLSLGGRRKPTLHSVNTAWRHPSFKGYADYMETEDFKMAIDQLEELASLKHAAYMCSEAVWWKCHRSLISDYLKVKFWSVIHIMDENKVQEHPYTSPARVIQGNLFYN